MTPPVPVAVLSGLDRLAVDDLATSLLLRAARVAVVHPDPRCGAHGHVTIRVQDADGRTQARQVELDHDCVTCTMRSATVATLVELARSGRYDALAVQLDPGVEADATLRGLVAELPAGLRVDTHVTVLRPDWLDALAGDAVVADHGLAVVPDDDRFVAPLVAAGVETATTIVRTGAGGSALERLEHDAVLDLLAPAAVRLRVATVLDAPLGDVLGTGRFETARLDPLAAYGLADPDRALDEASTLSLVRWSADRPLDPHRLHDALDPLADGVVRSTGRLHVADQPQAVVGWDSAGHHLLLGPVTTRRGGWDGWTSRLALLGEGLDGDRIRDRLDACLLDHAAAS